MQLQRDARKLGEKPATLDEGRKSRQRLRSQMKEMTRASRGYRVRKSVLGPNRNESCVWVGLADRLSKVLSPASTKPNAMLLYDGW